MWGDRLGRGDCPGVSSSSQGVGGGEGKDLTGSEAAGWGAILSVSGWFRSFQEGVGRSGTVPREPMPCVLTATNAWQSDDPLPPATVKGQPEGVWAAHISGL